MWLYTRRFFFSFSLLLLLFFFFLVETVCASFFFFPLCFTLRPNEDGFHNNLRESESRRGWRKTTLFRFSDFIVSFYLVTFFFHLSVSLNVLYLFILSLLCVRSYAFWYKSLFLTVFVPRKHTAHCAFFFFVYGLARNSKGQWQRRSVTARSLFFSCCCSTLRWRTERLRLSLV